MKDLEVGMYVRSNGYINKIVKIEDDEVTGKILLLDKYPYTYIEYEFDELKASHNIIDLIEEGDYVNGCAVIDKPYSYHDIKFILVDTKESWSYGRGEMPCSKIKSIVTKEQFESVAYEVEE